MQETEDILAAFDIESSIGKDEKQPITLITVEKIRAPIKKSHGTLQKTRNSGIFLVKYFTTSACIF